MKQKIVLFLFAGLLSAVLSSYHQGYAAVNQSDGTGATGSSGCSCHGSSSSISTTVELDSAGVAVSSYHPGMAYTVKISATNGTTSSLPAFGFQLAVVKSTGAGSGSAVQAGTWGSSLPINVQNTSPATSTLPIPIIEQSTQITATTGTGGNGTTYVESIPWTAPAAGTGSIKIYGVLNAVNNTGGSGGDKYKVAPTVTITEAIASAVVASVHIAQTTGTNPTCAGTAVTFTATPTNGGTAPTYQWKVNGTAVSGATASTYTTSSLTTGAIVTCVMTSSLSGVTGSPATSTGITITINPTLTPSVSISAPNTTICAGSSASFTATPTNGGTPSYQWKVNGINAGTNSATFASTTLANNDAVTCVLTSTATCAAPATATSNQLTISVATQTPTITISNTSGTHCSGAPDTFTAVETNGGTSPSFQWKVNGSNTGTNSSSFITSTLTNGQAVTCVLTSSLACASPTSVTSNAVSALITPTVTPTLSISTAQDTVCQNAVVSFIAIGTNLGTSPTYQWRIGTVNTGTNIASLSTNSLANGNMVSCFVTSSAACASPASVVSNNIAMTVTPLPVVTITPSGALRLCSGDSLLLTASGSNNYQWSNTDTGSTIWVHQSGIYNLYSRNGACTGSAAIQAAVTLDTPAVPTVTQAANIITASPASSYQWVLNGSPISGATAQSYTITQSGNYKVMTVDANGCHAISISYIFTYVNGINSIGADLGAKLYPTPNQGSFMIEAPGLTDADLVIYDIYGQKVYEQKLNSDKTSITCPLSSALYFVSVSEAGRTQTIKMQVAKD